MLYPVDTSSADRVAPDSAVFLRRLLPRDLLRRHHATFGTRLPGRQLAIQINDTHPAITVAELIRLLVDERSFDLGAGVGNDARRLRLYRTYAAARGTGDMAGHVAGGLLPRHLEIIFEINRAS